jgi:hypothetical protein
MHDLRRIATISRRRSVIIKKAVPYDKNMLIVERKVRSLSDAKDGTDGIARYVTTGTLRRSTFH